jgi:hypothetical protein
VTRNQVTWLRIPGDCCMVHVDHRTLAIHVPQAIQPEGHIDTRGDHIHCSNGRINNRRNASKVCTYPDCKTAQQREYSGSWEILSKRRPVVSERPMHV